MKKKRLLLSLPIALLLLFAAILLLAGGSADTLGENRLFAKIESILQKFGGVREQNGIFLTENALIENITAEDDAIFEANLSAVETYAENSRVPAVVVLLPTAAAIRQEDLPTGADLLNQKVLITQAYERLSGKAATVDAYSRLFSVRDSQLYYRTASNLTGLGGYYVYAALAPRLGMTARSLNEFEIENLPVDYYGDLYARVRGYAGSSDLLTLYHYTKSERTVRLLCEREEEKAAYTTLYPKHLMTLGRSEEVLLGGSVPLRDLTVSAPEEPSLLIYGDDTVTAYLPFLATHCRRITTVDPRLASTEQLSAVEDDEYDRILLICSLKTMLQEPIFSLLPQK